MRRLLKLSGLTALVLLAMLLTAGACLLLFAERRPDGPPPMVSTPQTGTAADRATSLLAGLYRAHSMPSLSAAVGLGGRLVWSGTVGHADLSARRPADAATRYRIGSVSKSITAVAVMRLAETGLVDLDAPYATYMADFPSASAGYSLKQLLSHQAGIRHYRGWGEMISNTPYAGPREAAAIFAGDPPLFPPGTGFSYSSHGYTAVALAMENAAGRPYAEIVRQLVLGPAGMDGTRLDHKGDPPGSAATRYMLLAGLLFEAVEDDLSDRQAGGGFLSTPGDLVRLGIALTSGDLLTIESRALMWTPVPLADGSMNPQRYALGFREGADDLGRYLHHGGTSNGGSAMLLIYPDLGLTVALCANYDGQESGYDRLEAARRLAALFMP